MTWKFVATMSLSTKNPLAKEIGWPRTSSIAISTTDGKVVRAISAAVFSGLASMCTKIVAHSKGTAIIKTTLNVIRYNAVLHKHAKTINRGQSCLYLTIRYKNCPYRMHY